MVHGTAASKAASTEALVEMLGISKWAAQWLLRNDDFVQGWMPESERAATEASHRQLGSRSTAPSYVATDQANARLRALPNLPRPSVGYRMAPLRPRSAHAGFPSTARRQTNDCASTLRPVAQPSRVRSTAGAWTGSSEALPARATTRQQDRGLYGGQMSSQANGSCGSPHEVMSQQSAQSSAPVTSLMRTSYSHVELLDLRNPHVRPAPSRSIRAPGNLRPSTSGGLPSVPMTASPSDSSQMYEISDATPVWREAPYAMSRVSRRTLPRASTPRSPPYF